MLGKSHILLSTKKPEIILIDDLISLTASSHEKLLGLTIDSKLKFENHITELCLKVSKNLAFFAVYQVRCHKKNINESIYRIAVQLFPLDMDATFYDIE